MAGLMDNLTALLTSECEAYEKLVKVSSQKTQTIIDGDIEKLQKITMQEQELTDMLQGILNLRDRLKVVLGEMKAVNDKNEMLLKQAIEMVEFDISLIKSLKQAPETANYNKSAYNTGTLLGNSGFDFKQ